MRERLKIDVWSDLACPWCYVGKKRLDKAIAALGLEGDSAVQVNWHSYIIDTRTNKEGEDYLAYNERRWGGDGWTADLRRSGGPDGAAFADWRWWPSTLQAHRLVALASKHGKGSAAKELLFQKTYEQGQNISQLDTLIAAGQELGLPDVEAYLRSDAGRDEVLADDVLGKQRLNISGVPYFIIGPADGGGQRLALSGAQGTRAFEQAMRRALAEQQ